MAREVRGSTPGVGDVDEVLTGTSTTPNSHPQTDRGKPGDTWICVSDSVTDGEHGDVRSRVGGVPVQVRRRTDST